MPAKKELVDYINNGLKDGHSVDSLRNTLINAGWPQQDVEDSIKYASGSVQNTPSKPAVNMGFFTRFKTVLFHPGSFFEAVKGEEGYSDAFKYFLILTLIPVLASSLSSTTSLGSSSQ
ncbi:MAG: hypothetical protein KAT35_03960, partial [Candidatus Aenigmarchaeota archaeon]|nr:hypothetical protein [Candidatus Aenigmarchaeota archaeon]